MAFSRAGVAQDRPLRPLRRPPAVRRQGAAPGCLPPIVRRYALAPSRGSGHGRAAPHSCRLRGSARSGAGRRHPIRRPPRRRVPTASAPGSSPRPVRVIAEWTALAVHMVGADPCPTHTALAKRVVIAQCSPGKDPAANGILIFAPGMLVESSEGALEAASATDDRTMSHADNYRKTCGHGAHHVTGMRAEHAAPAGRPHARESVAERPAAPRFPLAVHLDRIMCRPIAGAVPVVRHRQCPISREADRAPRPTRTREPAASPGN